MDHDSQRFRRSVCKGALPPSQRVGQSPPQRERLTRCPCFSVRGITGRFGRPSDVGDASQKCLDALVSINARGNLGVFTALLAMREPGAQSRSSSLTEFSSTSHAPGATIVSLQRATQSAERQDARSRTLAIARAQSRRRRASERGSALDQSRSSKHARRDVGPSPRGAGSCRTRSVGFDLRVSPDGAMRRGTATQALPHFPPPSGRPGCGLAPGTLGSSLSNSCPSYSTCRTNPKGLGSPTTTTDPPCPCCLPPVRPRCRGVRIRSRPEVGSG